MLPFWKSVSRQLDAYGLLRLDAKTQVRLSFSNLLHQSQQTIGTYDGVEAGTNLRQTTTSPSFTAIRIVLEKKL